MVGGRTAAGGWPGRASGRRRAIGDDGVASGRPADAVIVIRRGRRRASGDGCPRRPAPILSTPHVNRLQGSNAMYRGSRLAASFLLVLTGFAASATALLVLPTAVAEGAGPW